SATAAWAPADFGQARMAALGWLLSLARKQGPAEEEKVVATLRPAAGKGPRDPRPLWDWYYACAVRTEQKLAYEAALDLTHASPADPLAGWVYLSSPENRQYGPGPRYYVEPGSEENDGVAPLPPEEIEHVLASVRALRERRPELAQGSVLLTVNT